jgi:hypothetical protein
MYEKGKTFSEKVKVAIAVPTDSEAGYCANDT